MTDCIFLISKVTDLQNFGIGMRWSWTYSLLSFFFHVYNYMDQAILCDSQDAHLFSCYLKYLLLFMFKVSSSNVQYPIPQVSGTQWLGFSFQHTSWARLLPLSCDVSREQSFKSSFAHLCLYCCLSGQYPYWQGWCKVFFFCYCVSAITYKFFVPSVGNSSCESPWQIVLRYYTA